jgi:hypothetical protein
MTLQFQLPAQIPPKQLTNPVTTNGGVTTAVFGLKGVLKAWAVFDLTQAVGQATVISLKQATTVAAGTNKAGPTVPIWANEDTAASDTLVKQTSGASYTVTNNIKHKQVVFEIDPILLDVAGGYPYVYFTVSDSAQATNFVSAALYPFQSYQQATPPTEAT